MQLQLNESFTHTHTHTHTHTSHLLYYYHGSYYMGSGLKGVGWGSCPPINLSPYLILTVTHQHIFFVRIGTILSCIQAGPSCTKKPRQDSNFEFKINLKPADYMYYTIQNKQKLQRENTQTKRHLPENISFIA